ncbi:MAG: decaprenyl-phosphate phosphoribosyltransferase [Anaerolineae bacterium]|nr:decaprenyl-phosphate phosphoribosyltransferase [Anaerolineae bacterium]
MKQQLTGLIRTMRPKQWLKNGFIFIALVFDGKLTNPYFFSKTLAGFGLLCLTSSTVYLINDLVDIKADQTHPTKRNRPLPSGQLSKGVAIGAAVVLPLISLSLAYLLEPEFALILASYLALQIAYSFKLKHVVLIDAMTLAAGFLLRVAGGAALVDVVRFSPWLYVFTTLLALFLGFSKRRQELVLLQEGANSFRAILDDYNLKLLDELILIVTATTVLTYSLYTFSAEGLPPNHLMMLTIPFVLYGIFRYLYLIHVRGITDTPDEVVFKDRPIQLAVGLWGLTVVLILYLL